MKNAKLYKFFTGYLFNLQKTMKRLTVRRISVQLFAEKSASAAKFSAKIIWMIFEKSREKGKSGQPKLPVKNITGSLRCSGQ